MPPVAFLGAGSFGTALSIHLANKGCEVKIWDRKPQLIDEINNTRKNTKYSGDSILPNNITGYKELEDVLKDCEFVILAVPSHAIRDICRRIKGIIEEDAIVINIAKGIEVESKKRLSEVIEEELNNNVVVLTGPSHAEEVLLRMPTSIVASSLSSEDAEKVQDLFMNSYFRVYTNDDLIGVEIGGAVKNIIAFAAGVCDGIGYGDNSKAALITRGIKEITRIGEALGGKPDTFSGLTGIGDLIVTCTSIHSRNRKAGFLIGKGKSLEEATNEVGMIVEGVKACKAFFELKEQLKVDMPITDALYGILFKGMNPDDAVEKLMNRDKKNEMY